VIQGKEKEITEERVEKMMNGNGKMNGNAKPNENAKLNDNASGPQLMLNGEPVERTPSPAAVPAANGIKSRLRKKW